MWAKIKRFCLDSVTIAWSYIVAFVGAIFQIIDAVADALGDPKLKEQINELVGNPQRVGQIMLLISVVTIIARIRSIRKGA